MDDLISRSKVIDVLKETGIIQDNDLGHLVVEEIERIPTAYDVEKVEEKVGKILEFNMGRGSAPYFGIMSIIRKGGVE